MAWPDSSKSSNFESALLESESDWVGKLLWKFELNPLRPHPVPSREYFFVFSFFFVSLDFSEDNTENKNENEVRKNPKVKKLSVAEKKESISQKQKDVSHKAS